MPVPVSARRSSCSVVLPGRAPTALLRSLDTRLVGLDQHDFGVDAGARERTAQFLLRRAAGQDSDLLAGQELYIAGAVGPDHETRAVDEDRDREVDGLSARQGRGGR